MTIEFFVQGKPQPAGSKRAFPIKLKGTDRTRVSVTDANPKSKDWKATVAWIASGRHQGALLAGPLRVSLSFALSRPKGHYGTGKNLNRVKESSPPFPASKPDVLKLARAVEDALTGIVWVDDALIVSEVLEKRWGEIPGVSVKVESMSVEQESEPDVGQLPLLDF